MVPSGLAAEGQKGELDGRQRWAHLGGLHLQSVEAVPAAPEPVPQSSQRRGLAGRRLAAGMLPCRQPAQRGDRVELSDQPRCLRGWLLLRQTLLAAAAVAVPHQPGGWALLATVRRQLE